MSRVSVNVMAHPARELWAQRLAAELRCLIVWDRGVSVWDTRARCLEAHVAEGAEWGLTVQDDAILTRGFLSKAAAFLEEHDPDAAHLFTKHRPSRQELRRGWLRRDRIGGGVAIVLRTRLMGPLLHPAHDGDWWPDVADPTRHDDSRIIRYLRHVGVSPVFPVPSLVQHRDDGSLIYSPEELSVRKAPVFR